jgi:hypothetical protein
VQHSVKMKPRAVEKALEALRSLLEPGEEPRFASLTLNIRPNLGPIVITDRRVVLFLFDHSHHRSLWFFQVDSWELIVSKGHLRIDSKDGTSFTIKGIDARDAVTINDVMKTGMLRPPTGSAIEVPPPQALVENFERASAPAVDLVAQLEGLASLHEVGALSDEEFERAKLRILGS